MWLLVGITRKEIRQNNYNMPVNRFVTLDRGDFGPFRNGDIDFKHDAFDVDVWRRIMTIFGPGSFDCIFTDGGLFGIKRVDEIVQIKRRLLKSTGVIVNYSSPIGQLIRCPFGRPLQFKCISRQMYTIDNMIRAYKALNGSSIRDQLLKQVQIII